MADLASDVVARFQRLVTSGVRDYKEMVLAAYGKRRQASLESMLSAQYALNLTVQWEVFLNDLLIAYVARDPETFMRTLRGKVEQSIREKFGAEVWRSVTLTLPTSVAVARVPAWIDPKEFNITFRSSEALAQRANLILAAKYAKSFTLASDDAGLVDFTIGLRNYLAHNSAASRVALLTHMAALKGPNSELAAPRMREIGHYLKSGTASGDVRVCVIASRLSQVAGGLVL